MIESGSNINGLFDANTTQTELQRQADYKSFTGSHKRYYKCGKMYKKKNGDMWRSTGNPSFQAYDNATTQIQMQTLGYGNGDIAGYITITWYCAFKGF